MQGAKRENKGYLSARASRARSNSSILVIADQVIMMKNPLGPASLLLLVKLRRDYASGNYILLPIACYTTSDSDAAVLWANPSHHRLKNSM